MKGVLSIYSLTCPAMCQKVWGCKTLRKYVGTDTVFTKIVLLCPFQVESPCKEGCVSYH